MFCKNCGKEVADNSKFCSGCGANLLEDVAKSEINKEAEEVKEEAQPVVDNTAEEVTTEEKQEVKEEVVIPASVVINNNNVVNQTETPTQTKVNNTYGLVGFICSFVMPLLGLIFSAIGYKKRKECDGWNAFATAGLAISIVSLSVSLFIFVIYFSIISCATCMIINDPYFYEDSYYYIVSLFM